MEIKLERIDYRRLNAKQQENYNFQKVSAVLADYGFVTIKLSDDWNGADFIALHKDGKTLKVQLKGRLTFGKRYLEKELWVCFRDKIDWYLYPHDKLYYTIFADSSHAKTKSWVEVGGYDFPGLSAKNKLALEPYRLVEPAYPTP